MGVPEQHTRFCHNFRKERATGDVQSRIQGIDIFAGVPTPRYRQGIPIGFATFRRHRTNVLQARSFKNENGDYTPKEECCPMEGRGEEGRGRYPSPRETSFLSNFISREARLEPDREGFG